VNVRVLLFAGLRERAGSDHVELELTDGAQVGDALEQLHGLIGDVRVVMAVNREYARPDVVLLSTIESAHPNSADVLFNPDTKPNGTCQVPAPTGIAVCSPASGATVSSPVNFAFSANSFYPMRKMEVWVDGTKRSETYEVFANQGFANLSLPLAAGTHSVALFAGGFDGTVQKRTYSIKVQ